MKPEQLIAKLRASSVTPWLKRAWSGAEKRGVGTLAYDDVQAEIDRHRGSTVLGLESKSDTSA